MKYDKLIVLLKNAAYSPVNLALRNVKPSSLKPRGVVFEVTNACNSKCRHCNIWRNRIPRNILTVEEIKNVFSDELFSDLKDIIVTGGEPTLRNDLEDVLLTISKVLPKTNIWLSTNGILPKRVLEVVKYALENHIKIGIGVSLDGVGKEHDLIRRVPGNFEKIDYLLHELVKLKKKYKKLVITIGFTISEFTVNSLKDVAEYSKKFDIDFLPQMYELASYYGHKKDKHNLNKKIIDNMTKTIESTPSTIQNEILLHALKGGCLKFPCFALHTFCLLRADGNIAPCLKLAHVSAGNVRDYPPHVIWNSIDAKKIRSCVKNCKGCLYTWGVGWSFEAGSVQFVLQNIPLFIKILKEEFL